MTRAASLLAAGLWAAGCAGVATAPGVARSVALGPGGHADGRLVVPPGQATSIHLENRGPGIADFWVRMGSGVVLQSGVLESVADIRFTPTNEVAIVVALEAHAGAATTVDAAVDGAGGARFEWERTEAGR